MVKLKVTFKLIDSRPLETMEDEIKAVKTIIKNEFNNYDFTVTEILVEGDHS